MTAESENFHDVDFNFWYPYELTAVWGWDNYLLKKKLTTDLCCIRDRIPAISFSRTLRKGDILELKVLAIENPGSFYVKMLGPKELLVEGQYCKSLSGFGAKLSSFYDRFQDEEVLAIKEFSLERGETLGYLLFSSSNSYKDNNISLRFQNTIAKSFYYVNYEPSIISSKNSQIILVLKT